MVWWNDQIESFEATIRTPLTVVHGADADLSRHTACAPRGGCCQLRVLRQNTVAVSGRWRVEGGPPCRNLLLRDQHIDASLIDVNFDHVAVSDERNRPADCGFGRHVANGQTLRAAAKPAIGDDRNGAA